MSDNSTTDNSQQTTNVPSIQIPTVQTTNVQSVQTPTIKTVSVKTNQLSIVDFITPPVNKFVKCSITLKNNSRVNISSVVVGFTPFIDKFDVTEAGFQHCPFNQDLNNADTVNLCCSKPFFDTNGTQVYYVMIEIKSVLVLGDNEIIDVTEIPDNDYASDTVNYLALLKQLKNKIRQVSDINNISDSIKQLNMDELRKEGTTIIPINDLNIDLQYQFDYLDF